MTQHSRTFAPGAAVVLQAPALLGQAPRPAPGVTFQVEVNYVDVDVVVTDEQGQFVTGLTRDDFAVFEDGKPQKIDTFSLVDIPVEKPDEIVVEGRAIPADTRTNREPFDGRVYVIVLDDLDVSAMRSTPVRDAARRFVREHMAANDLGAVVYTSGRSDAAQEFTTDRELLITCDRQVSGPAPAVAQPRAARRVLPAHRLRLQPEERRGSEYWIDQLAGSRGLRADVRPHGARARHPCADRARHVEEYGGVSGQRARTPQSRAVLQRRARLSHPRRVRRARCHRRHSRDAGCDLDSGARQRQLLHNRSAWPGGDDDRLHGIGRHRQRSRHVRVRCCWCRARTRPSAASPARPAACSTFRMN